MNKEQFEIELNKIGFSIKGTYPNSFIFNSKNERTPFRVRSDGIEMSRSFDYNVTIGFESIKSQIIEGSTLSIQDINGGDNPSFFVQFHSHSSM